MKLSPVLNGTQQFHGCYTVLFKMNHWVLCSMSNHFHGIIIKLVKVILCCKMNSLITNVPLNRGYKLRVLESRDLIKKFSEMQCYGFHKFV